MPTPHMPDIDRLTFGNVPPRRVSLRLLETFNIAIQTPRDLYDLQVELDSQCLQLVIRANAGANTGEDLDLVRAQGEAFAERLSSSLNRSGHSGRFGFQEAQLRALVSSLGLLHHGEVRSLNSDFWEVLKGNISQRFNEITCQLEGTLTLTERARHTSNVYLVQLASQYLSFLRRGDSTLPSVVGPAVSILFASISVVRRMSKPAPLMEDCRQSLPH